MDYCEWFQQISSLYIEAGDYNNLSKFIRMIEKNADLYGGSNEDVLKEKCKAARCNIAKILAMLDQAEMERRNKT